MEFLCQNALRTKYVLMKSVLVLIKVMMERIVQLYVNAIAMTKLNYVAPGERMTMVVLYKTSVMKGVVERIM
jgi:hypothetical protein